MTRFSNDNVWKKNEFELRLLNDVEKLIRRIMLNWFCRVAS
jgi:hypothetical protein